MPTKTAGQIAQLIQMACALEVCAPKPGNVNRCHDFADSSLEDFLLSAISIGPAFEGAASDGVGQIILNAVSDTGAWVRSNTNLGMILLFAPLAKACVGISGFSEIRPKLKKILNALTVEDARLAYTAIRRAQPGGLGTVAHSDISEDPSVTLLQAMAFAQDRDSIAREYVTDYAVTFEIGLPVLNREWNREDARARAIVQTYLCLLSEVPDTLIARKKGPETARKIAGMAKDVLAKGGIHTHDGRQAIAAMDRALRDEKHALNPGTTADLTAAALFLAMFARELEKDS